MYPDPTALRLYVRAALAAVRRGAAGLRGRFPAPFPPRLHLATRRPLSPAHSPPHPTPLPLALDRRPFSPPLDPGRPPRRVGRAGVRKRAY